MTHDPPPMAFLMSIVLGRVRRLETERAGLINALGRTLAEDVYAEEGAAAGELALASGALIGPAEMGLLAAIGRPGVEVTRRPRVSVVTVGDEIIDLMEKPSPDKVRNSSRYNLAGHVFASRCELGRLLQAGDSAESVRKCLDSARASDAIIVGGCGASLLGEMAEVLLDGLAISPGETTAFALFREKPVFILPGDPLGQAVAFELTVRPALLTMLGRRTVNRPAVTVWMAEDLRHVRGRTGFIHAAMSEKSGRLVARLPDGKQPDPHRRIMDSNCLVVIPEERDIIRTGETAEAMVVNDEG